MRYPQSLSLAVLVLSACGGATDRGPSLERFSGTYGQGGVDSDTVVTFQVRDGALLMHPALWSGPLVLRQVSADSFFVAAHPRFGVRFRSDGQAAVHGLSHDTEFRLLQGDPRGILLLIEGQPAGAAQAYIESDDSQLVRYVNVGRQFYRSAPSRVEEVVEYLQELSRLAPDSPEVQHALGGVLVAQGSRARAEQSYRRALLLDPEHGGARRALVRMGAEEPEAAAGWVLPFSLDSLYQTPRPSEIEAVIADWESRELHPVDPEIVLRRPVEVDGAPAEARVVAHRLHGQRHLGVVIVPEGATGLPVLVEAKGVSPNFFPLSVPDGLTSPFLLAEDRSNVIIAAPGYRGETLIVGSDTLRSEGDQRNAWDGATDDLIAFLRVALEVTPEADSSRVCVFGRSRGGTVAILAGMRESRIDCVVSWAAPTDWFELMGPSGWKPKELVAEGLRNRSTPNQIGGQNIDVFLADAIQGSQDLQESRARMIAGSPLYFAGPMGRAQVHWGIEDPIVPVSNGQAFVNAYVQGGGVTECLETHFHPVAGHDQDRQRAPIRSREFIMRTFQNPGSNMSCR